MQRKLPIGSAPPSPLMASPPETQSALLAPALLCVSAPDSPQHLSRGPQLPADAEEIRARFSPGEEYSSNNQPEKQPPEDEVASMEEIHS